MPPKTSDKKDNPLNSHEKMVEIYLPSGIKHYLTPVALVISSLLVSLSVALTFNPELRPQFNQESSTKGVSTTSEGFKNFKLGSIVDKKSTFTQYDNQPCTEDGKPVVFMFSATWCPHCQWVGETFNKWAKEQDDVVVYRYEVDTGDNSLTPERESQIPEEHKKIYEAFNPNQSIPTYVFACQYGRIGNGFESENNGLEKEIKEYNLIVEEIR